MKTFRTAAAVYGRQSGPGGHRPPLRPIFGFTLLELLVVVGLIAGLAFLLVGSLTGGGRAMALQSAQSIVANLITAARTKAPAVNRKTRLLLNIDPAQPERYLCHLVLQVARQPGSAPADWDTVQAVTLPAGAYVVPSALDGLVADAAEWKRVTDSTADLVSDIFTNQALNHALEGDAAAQLWTGLAFTPNHTLAALSSGLPPKGAIILASGRPLAPGTYATGQPPVELIAPQSVRGLMLSAYGVPALLSERSAF
jgi:type II secretory pathway pseudopilin PulG